MVYSLSGALTVNGAGNRVYLGPLQAAHRWVSTQTYVT